MFCLRKKIGNGLAACQAKRKIQSYYQNKEIPKHSMDAFAQRQANFGLREMHQSPRKDKINHSGNGPTAGYAHGVRMVGVRFSLPRI